MSVQSVTDRAEKGMRSTLTGMAANGLLAIAKGLAGVFGNSFALVADAIESLADVLSSFIVWLGIKLSLQPPDKNHPQGHGKIEPIAAAIVSLMLFAAAAAIVVQSVRMIMTPHQTPAAWTLIVLLVVIATKELLFRYINEVGNEVNSTAVKGDAWHHRSDALTSAAAFIGIGIALIGGKGYEAADDWAAIFASGIIALNAYRILQTVLEELTDAAPDSKVEDFVRGVAESVLDVKGTHRCYVRKMGFDYHVELDVLVDGNLSVEQGHTIAHRVRDAIAEEAPEFSKVFIHIEPVQEHKP